MVPTDLEAAVDELGLARGRSTAREVWTLCPNPDHDDTRPTSYSINRESGSGYCFACGFRHRDFLSLLSRLQGLDGWQAHQWVRDRGGSLSVRLARVEREPVEEQQTTIEGFSLAAQIAVYSTEIPEEELAARNITADSAREYGVRWDGASFVLPLHDPHTHDLLGWQVRTKPRPLNHPRGVRKSRTLFGIEIFRGPRAVLVESPLDAVRLLDAGIAGGLASFGARVSEAQIRLILDRAERLLIALDDDDAGRRMTEKIVAEYGHRLPIHVFAYEEGTGKDPGELSNDEILAGVRNARFALARPLSAL